MLICAIVAGSFSLLCISFWLLLDFQRYTLLAFNPPRREELSRIAPNVTYGDWVFVYWVTRTLLISVAVILSMYLIL